jgi:hypothetical protein
VPSNLGYLLLIPGILLSGLVITLDSWARAFRQGGFLNYGAAVYNTDAQIHNAYHAITSSSRPPARTGFRRSPYRRWTPRGGKKQGGGAEAGARAGNGGGRRTGPARGRMPGLAKGLDTKGLADVISPLRQAQHAVVRTLAQGYDFQVIEMLRQWLLNESHALSGDVLPPGHWQ